jgi:hypothetical protein
MADRYGIYCGSFTHAGGTLHLQQLDEQDLQSGCNYKTIRPGGALNPHAHILSTANPRARFRTCDCATLMTAMSSNFHLYCSGGHVMRYQKRLEGGAFAVGSDHLIQSTAKGFLHVSSIDVDIDSNQGATFDLEYIPLSVAGENPIAESVGENLDGAPIPAFGSQFFMGGNWLGASQTLGLVRMRIQPGLRIVARRSDGGVFPRSDGTSIVARDPMIELHFLNAAISASAIGSFFMNALGASIKSYLQRGTTAADGRIAAATASHFRVVASAGSWGPENLRVAGEDDAITVVRVMPTGDLTPTLGVALGV